MPFFSVYVTVSNSRKKGGRWVKWAWLSASINVQSRDTIIASPTEKSQLSVDYFYLPFMYSLDDISSWFKA